MASPPVSLRKLMGKPYYWRQLIPDVTGHEEIKLAFNGQIHIHLYGLTCTVLEDATHDTGGEQQSSLSLSYEPCEL